MIPFQFNAKIWKQGNSFIITIPIEIVKEYGMNESDYLHVTAILKDKNEVKEEREMNQLKYRFPYSGKGIIKHNNEDVAILDSIIYKTFESGDATISMNFEEDYYRLVHLH